MTSLGRYASPVVKVGPGGPKRGGYVESLGNRRRQNVQADVEQNAPGLKRPTAAQARPLTAAGLSGKLVDVHWPHLAGAVAPAAKLAAAQNELTGNAARVYTRAWSSAQKVISAQLSALPEAERSEAATRTLTALARLADEVGANPLLPTALSAASGLIDTSIRMRARGTLELSSDDLQNLGEESVDAVLMLLERIGDRRGQSSMLNVLPRIVEELQLAHPKLDAGRSKALTREVARTIADRLPKAGTNLAELAQVTALVSKQVRTKNANLDRALDEAFGAYAATRDQAVAMARGGLDQNQPVDQALGLLLDANPAAPDALLEAVEQLVAAVRPYAGQQELTEGVAGAVRRFANAPVGEAVVRHLAAHVARFQPQPNAVAQLQAAGAEANGHGFARQLIRTHLAATGQALEAYDEHLPELDRLSEGGAVQVATVLGTAIMNGRGSPELLQTLIERSAAGGDDDPIATLERISDTHQALAALLVNYPVLQAEKQALAEAGAVVPAGGDAMNRLLQSLSIVKERLPDVPLQKLVSEDKDGRPGLAQLAAAAGWAQDPVPLLSQLLQEIQAHAGPRRDLQEPFARAAISLALRCSGIQNAEALHLPRIREDWRLAVEDPEALAYADRARGAADIRAKKSVIGFLDAHPEIPVDFAFTAGRHLTPAQLSWAADRLGNAGGLDASRFLRDTVFALVAANRLDVMDALVGSKSPSKAISGVLRELASRFQRNALADAPFDEIVAGLNAGTDPVAEIKAKEAKEAFQGVDLHALAEGNMTEEGLAEVMAIKDNVADLIVQYSPGFEVWQYDRATVDMTKLLDPFLTAVKDTLQGTWPKRKYEDEVGVRQLAGCTPEQRAIWRQSTVTMEQDEAVAPAAVDTSIVPLAHGLAKALEDEVRLQHPDLDGLAWDAASKQRLEELRDGLLETLRNSKKGSDEHRSASKKLGPIADRLRVVDLKLTLDALAGEENPAAIAAALKPVVNQALPALKKLRARGCAEAAAMIVAALPAASGPKERALTGAYAIDEDSLTAMIDSHKSGCLSFGDKRRRWGMCGSLTDANTKMLHTFRDGAQKYRTFLRLLPTKFDGYEGPALFIESPVGDSGGGANDLTLLHKGLFAKARAMGVPVIGASHNPPEGWTHQNLQTTLTFDWGHTGLYHSDRLSDVKAQGNGGQPVEKAQTIAVSIPPELAARIAK